MNTAMDLRVAIAKGLPDDLQEVIWRSYYTDTVLPWLMVEMEVKLQNKSYEKLFDKYCNYVVEQVNRLCPFYQENQLWFNMNMDFAEDRLLDVVFSQEGRELFDMYQVIKENITHPYLLCLDLIGMVDSLRSQGRKKLHACILCDMFLERLVAMIMPNTIFEDDEEEDV